MLQIVCISTGCILVACIIIHVLGINPKFSNGVSLARGVGGVCILLAVGALPVAAVWDWFQARNQKREENFNRFLSDYAPSLKAKRDEVRQVISGVKDKKEMLQKARKNYKSKDAIAKIDNTISQIDEELARLGKAIVSLDNKIEDAMAAKDIRKADSGGLQSGESRELLDSTDSILRQANELKQSIEDEAEGTSVPSNDQTNSAQSGEKPVNFHTDSTAPLPRDAADKSPTGPESDFDTLLREANKLSQPEPGGTKSPSKPNPGELPKPGSRKTPSQGSKPPPPAKPAGPTRDRAAIETEIRQLDASIATHEDNLNRAWARVNAITRNHTVPVVRGSRQHQEIQAIERAIQLSESQLPGLKNRRDELKAKLEGK